MVIDEELEVDNGIDDNGQDEPSEVSNERNRSALTDSKKDSDRSGGTEDDVAEFNEGGISDLDGMFTLFKIPPSTDIRMGKSDGPTETAFLLQQYGIGGRCYTDSRVMDMINEGAGTDSLFLLELLRHIHHDWIHEHGEDEDHEPGMPHRNIMQHITY